MGKLLGRNFNWQESFPRAVPLVPEQHERACAALRQLFGMIVDYPQAERRPDMNLSVVRMPLGKGPKSQWAGAGALTADDGELANILYAEYDPLSEQSDPGVAKPRGHSGSRRRADARSRLSKPGRCTAVSQYEYAQEGGQLAVVRSFDLDMGTVAQSPESVERSIALARSWSAIGNDETTLGLTGGHVDAREIGMLARRLGLSLLG